MKLTSDQAFELSVQLRDISVAVGDILRALWNTLSEQERVDLENKEWSLLNASSDVRTAAVGLVLDETQLNFTQLVSSTASAKLALATLNQIRKALDIATAAVELAAAIVSRDFEAIAKKTVALAQVVKG